MSDGGWISLSPAEFAQLQQYTDCEYRGWLTPLSSLPVFLSIRGFFLQGLSLFGCSQDSGGLAGNVTHTGAQPAVFKGSSTLATFPCWHEEKTPITPTGGSERGERSCFKGKKGPVTTLQWGGDP